MPEVPEKRDIREEIITVYHELQASIPRELLSEVGESSGNLLEVEMVLFPEANSGPLGKVYIY